MRPNNEMKWLFFSYFWFLRNGLNRWKKLGWQKIRRKEMNKTQNFNIFLPLQKNCFSFWFLVILLFFGQSMHSSSFLFFTVIILMRIQQTKQIEQLPQTNFCFIARSLSVAKTHLHAIGPICLFAFDYGPCLLTLLANQFWQKHLLPGSRDQMNTKKKNYLSEVFYLLCMAAPLLTVNGTCSMDEAWKGFLFLSE